MGDFLKKDLWELFLIAILHRDLRNAFFFSLQFTFHILFGLLLPFSVWTFIFPFLFGLLFSLVYLDFYFSLGLLFLFKTFISLLDFSFFFWLLSAFSHKSRSDLGFLPSFFFTTAIWETKHCKSTLLPSYQIVVRRGAYWVSLFRYTCNIVHT